MSSKLMVKEKELTKLKEDYKLLVKQFGNKKETIPQVRTYVYTNPKIKESTLH